MKVDSKIGETINIGTFLRVNQTEVHYYRITTSGEQ